MKQNEKFRFYDKINIFNIRLISISCNKVHFHELQGISTVWNIAEACIRGIILPYLI